jgi:hypothetical protein
MRYLTPPRLLSRTFSLFRYADVGVRPIDVASAAWTLEFWVRLGSAKSGGEGGHSPSGFADAPDADGSGTPTVDAPGDPAASLSQTLAARLERVADAASPIGVAGRFQWSLTATAGGALCFSSFADAASPDAASSVTTSRGVLPWGEWRHVAVVVDGSVAAKACAARVRAAEAARASVAATGGGVSQAAGGETGGSTPMPSTPSPPVLPPLAVSLFVNGVCVEEGSVTGGLPLPLLEAADGVAAEGGPASGTIDALLLCPDASARMGEVRLWAKKRAGVDLAGGKDFHLDLAESRRIGGGGLAVKIKAASTTAASALSAPSSLKTAVKAALAVSALPPLGGLKGGVSAAVAAARAADKEGGAAAAGAAAGAAAQPVAAPVTNAPSSVVPSQPPLDVPAPTTGKTDADAAHVAPQVKTDAGIAKPISLSAPPPGVTFSIGGLGAPPAGAVAGGKKAALLAARQRASAAAAGTGPPAAP